MRRNRSKVPDVNTGSVILGVLLGLWTMLQLKLPVAPVSIDAIIIRLIWSVSFLVIIAIIYIIAAQAVIDAKAMEKPVYLLITILGIWTWLKYYDILITTPTLSGLLIILWVLSVAGLVISLAIYFLFLFGIYSYFEAYFEKR